MERWNHTALKNGIPSESFLWLDGIKPFRRGLEPMEATFFCAGGMAATISGGELGSG